MTIYAAVSPGENDRLADAIKASFPDDYFHVAPGQYLVHAPRSTTKQVSDALGISDGSLGKVLLLQVSNYKGWHSRDMWEWLESKSGVVHAAIQTPDHEL